MATAAGKPKPPHKARAAAKKGHAAASQARSARKPRSAKKGAQPRRKAGNARPGSKTAKILDLVKRPSGATLKELLRATSWQPHRRPRTLTDRARTDMDDTRVGLVGGLQEEDS
jgi:hypothetical protein